MKPHDVLRLRAPHQPDVAGGDVACPDLHQRDARIADLLCVPAGACAGAWAVLCSMPADCIKTRLELTATRSGGGVLTNAALFMRTARGMVKQEGPQSMFVGIGPRLACAIPSAMEYWLSVEACRRALEPVTQQEAPAGAVGSPA